LLKTSHKDRRIGRSWKENDWRFLVTTLGGCLTLIEDKTGFKGIVTRILKGVYFYSTCSLQMWSNWPHF
jgi:hypothetical protein